MTSSGKGNYDAQRAARRALIFGSTVDVSIFGRLAKRVKNYVEMASYGVLRCTLGIGERGCRLLLARRE